MNKIISPGKTHPKSFNHQINSLEKNLVDLLGFANNKILFAKNCCQNTFWPRNSKTTSFPPRQHRQIVRKHGNLSITEKL